MWFRNYYPTIVKNTKKYEIVCPHCNNKAANQIYEFYSGFLVGVVFSDRPITGRRNYYLVCPICNNPNKELTLEEVNNSFGDGVIKEKNISNNNYCTNCGNTIEEEYFFCKHCGIQIK